LTAQAGPTARPVGAPESNPSQRTSSINTQPERIRALNDKLRTSGIGGDIIITRGVHALPPDTVLAVIAAVQSFNAFTAANDPYGEHDFALLEVGDQRVMFKIDYYNLALSGHSPDAADPAVTRRVLTIMLAAEY
jgi:hypothetical protein